VPRREWEATRGGEDAPLTRGRARARRGRGVSRAPRAPWIVSLVLLGAAAPASGQELRGLIVETGTDTPVALAGVFLLDADREITESVLADSVGRYRIRAPEGGEYILRVQRLGYFETESPLFALSHDGVYELDVEVRPEPIRLDPLLVTVRNEEMERWYTLALGQNPNSILGFRAIQGARLEEARLKAKDNTDLFRWLYVPVRHGREVCLGEGMPRPERGTGRIGERPCGTLWVDGVQVPAEHIESIDTSEIALVVVMPPSVEIFTYGFDWSARPSRTRLLTPKGTGSR